jgi:hypothetical protein
MYPDGGGFLIKCKAWLIRQASASEITPEKNEQRFTMDWLCDIDPDISFAGVTKNEHWNGWAVPYFSLAEGQRMISWLLLRSGDVGNDLNLRYDDNEDTFVWTVPGGDSVTSSCFTFKGVKYYRIFSDFCWEEVEEILHA